MGDLARFVKRGVEAIGAVRRMRGEHGVRGCGRKVVRGVRLVVEADGAGVCGSGEGFAARADGRWVRTGVRRSAG